MKPKILHIIQSLDRGGCETMLLRTLPLLNNFEHKILTLKQKGELSREFEKKGIPIIQKKLLLKQIKKYNPDLIFTYLFHADVIGRIIIQPLTNYKVVPFLRTTYNYRKYLVAQLFEYLTRPWVDRYLANSNAIKKIYTQKLKVDSKKITVIPNGINVEKYNRIKPNSKLYEQLGIHKKNLIIVCVANLAKNKGHQYLLEAFEKVYQKNKEIYLLLVGDSPYKSVLTKQIANYHSKVKIKFLGKRRDIPQILKISDIFVLPTLFEGMSNAIMEAAASKCPIITTDILENRTLLKNAIFIPPRNSQKIYQAIIQLASRPRLRKKMAQLAFQEIKQNYDLAKSIKMWENFINRMI